MALVPYSLGFVTVATAGSPVPLSSAATVVKLLRLQPRRSNTVLNVGNVYLKTSSGSVFAILAPEQVQGVVNLAEGVQLSSLFLDADTNGDGALVGYLI